MRVFAKFLRGDIDELSREWREDYGCWDQEVVQHQSGWGERALGGFDSRKALDTQLMQAVRDKCGCRS